MNTSTLVGSVVMDVVVVVVVLVAFAGAAAAAAAARCSRRKRISHFTVLFRIGSFPMPRASSRWRGRAVELATSRSQRREEAEVASREEGGKL